MKVLATNLPGVIMVDPDVFTDARGSFAETYHAERYAEAGIAARFVQDNESHSAAGTLRGLHYQLHRPQGKLVRVTQGEVFDVAVDIRRGSPAFGRWAGVVLSAANQRQLFIPPGFAHGFFVLAGPARVAYKCTDYYCPDDQYGIRWDDPDLMIEWPYSASDPLLSERDRAFPLLRELGDALPRYHDD